MNKISDKVIFHGFVEWGHKLFSLLASMDIFVLSSISEGMPRALIEAMAQGLPCISTNVPGADELLGKNELVSIGDYKVLAKKIYNLISNPKELTELSHMCWKKAQEFRKDILKKKRRLYLNDFKSFIMNK